MPAAIWGFLLTSYWPCDGQLTLKRNSYQLFFGVLLFVGRTKAISSLLWLIFHNCVRNLETNPVSVSAFSVWLWREDFLFLNLNWSLQVARLLCCIIILSQILLVLLLENLYPFCWVFRFWREYILNFLQLKKKINKRNHFYDRKMNSYREKWGFLVTLNSCS